MGIKYAIQAAKEATTNLAVAAMEAQIDEGELGEIKRMHGLLTSLIRRIDRENGVPGYGPINMGGTGW